jgi:hypothetical protein
MAHHKQGEAMSELIKFPERITRASPTDQFEQLRTMKVRHMLAAVIRQVGPVSFTADDLAAEDGTAECVYDPKENEWVIKLKAEAL